MNEDFIALLRKHDIGLVVADTAGKWPKLFDVTSDFVYVRLHGDVKIYTSGYTEPRARRTGRERIRGWERDGRDVYVYFDNDVKVKAPFDALNLMPSSAWMGSPVHARQRVPRLKYAMAARHGRESRVGRPETIPNSYSRHSSAPFQSGVRREGSRRISFGRRRSAVKK